MHLPDGWRFVTLDDVASPVPNAIVDGPFGSNLKVSDYVEDGIPVLQGKNLTDDIFRWFDIRFISEHKAQELKRSAVREGDILIVKIGSIGYSALLDNLHGYPFAMIPANLAKVTPNGEVIDTEYLRYWLASPESKRYLIQSASQTAQPALSLGKIRRLPLPLPPLDEQRRIVSILKQVDLVRGTRCRSVELVNELFSSLRHRAFRGEL